MMSRRLKRLAAVWFLMTVCMACNARGKSLDFAVIEPESAARLMPVIQKLANGKLDMSTFSYMRTDVDPHERASVQTERVSQSDGTQRWQNLDCWTSRNPSREWNCIASEHRTLHIDWDDYRRWIEVTLKEEMSATLARQLVTGLLTELSHTKALPICEGKHKPFGGGELVDWILWNDQVALDHTDDGYSLGIIDFDFDFDAVRTPPVRLKCVHFGEEIQ